MNRKPSLDELYSKTSKHSHYQALPTAVLDLLEETPPGIRSRFERERLQFLQRHLPIGGLEVADIGGNTGYFTIELLNLGARKLTYYEGNRSHAEFLHAAAEQLSLLDRLQIHNSYLDLAATELPAPVDLTLLLNVLHHSGDDYGAARSIDHAKALILRSINHLARSSRWLLLQIGFNWKGDRNLGLFADGTKQEMLHYLEEGTRSDWQVQAVGIAEELNGDIEYATPNAENLVRCDAMGEFLNRPLLLLRSKRIESLEGLP